LLSANPEHRLKSLRNIRAYITGQRYADTYPTPGRL
jgi:hypothetical protein